MGGGVLIMVEEKMKCRLIRKSRFEDLGMYRVGK